MFAIFGRLHFCPFRPFLGILRRLHFDYSRSYWPLSGGCFFFVIGHFGHLLAPAFLLFSAVLGSFSKLQFYYFRPFLGIFRRLHLDHSRPYWPLSGGCIFLFFFRPFWAVSGSSIFIISGRVGHFWVAAFLLSLAVSAHFGRLHFYYFRPFWGIFRWLHFYYLRPFWPFSGGCLGKRFFGLLSVLLALTFRGVGGGSRLGTKSAS